jgi:hypothetical protein
MSSSFTHSLPSKTSILVIGWISHNVDRYRPRCFGWAGANMSQPLMRTGRFEFFHFAGRFVVQPVCDLRIRGVISTTIAVPSGLRHALRGDVPVYGCGVVEVAIRRLAGPPCLCADRNDVAFDAYSGAFKRRGLGELVLRPVRALEGRAAR